MGVWASRSGGRSCVFHRVFFPCFLFFPAWADTIISLLFSSELVDKKIEEFLSCFEEKIKHLTEEAFSTQVKIKLEKAFNL